MSSQLFNSDSMSKSYRSRPDYSKEIVNEIIIFWQQFNTNQKIEKNLEIVDVACGSGQLTVKLIPYAKKLLGIDTSMSQIDQAKNIFKELSVQNCRFLVGTCETIPVKDSSIDLMTCAQAMHWFDVDKFYTEVDRCLKPGGILAVLTYGRGYFTDGLESEALKQLNQFVSQDFWYDDKYLGPFVAERPRWAWTLLPGLRVLYPESGVRVDTMGLDLEFSVRRYGEYLRSTSMYRAWKEANGQGQDLVEYALKRILDGLGRPDKGLDHVLPMRFPLAMIMCAKPR